ncbi:MUC16 protein, partial [Pedionomus torquatus]|nr:MUC16 protein [Pedionomus torquatus]
PLSPAVRNFTLNFTVTNLPFTTDLAVPNSKKFKSTEKVIGFLICIFDLLKVNANFSTVTKRSSNTPFFPRSKEDRDDTGVDAICSYRDDLSDPTFSRVTVYQELSNMTKGITELGHFSLHSQSLYIDG